MAQVKARIQRWGNSMCVRIPSPLLKAWGVGEDQSLSLSIEDGVFKAKPDRPSYKLNELLAKCDFSKPMSKEEIEWLGDASVGLEQI
jgi:antitoxin component of MazEF toxin-antitoxin module